MGSSVVELARELIRLDTTNPPGQEHIAAGVIERVLGEAGIKSTRYESTPGRTNLVARVKGKGEAPPLLLQGHIDVVTTVGQAWTHPPFAAEIAGGYLWGRGALDMKGGVAMMVDAALRAAEDGSPGDLVLALLADEEAGGVFGASWLVDKHPELFSGVKHAIGEGGGEAQHLGGRRFYPVMVSEKRGCQMVVRLRGPGGHGSIPMRGGAMARLADVLARGRSSRLYRKLVVERQLAQDVSAHQSPRELAGSFGAHATLRPGIAVETVRDAIDAEITALASAGPTDAELSRVKNGRLAGFFYALDRKVRTLPRGCPRAELGPNRDRPSGREPIFLKGRRGERVSF